MKRFFGWVAVGLCVGGCALPEYDANPEVDRWLAGLGGSETGSEPGLGGAGKPATGGKRSSTGGAPPTGGKPPATGGAPPTGGNPPATGGVPPTGGNPPATGGTPPTAGAPASPYIDDSTIHGYCFGVDVIGGVLTEWNVEDELCGDYTLPNTSWDDVAMVGCNVNQPRGGGEGSEGTWMPTTESGICVLGSGFERIQIQGPNGATDEIERWCTDVSRGGGCAEWSEFNTQCWPGGDGIDYDYEPLQTVMALQPSLGDGVDVIEPKLSDTLCVTDVYVY
jgi:hypothetical protein